jgi:ChrR-like protein with cupin domain
VNDQAFGGERSAPFENQTRIVNVNDMPWREARTPGIRFKVLYRDEKTGASTMLLQFAPGAKTPLHQHTSSRLATRHVHRPASSLSNACAISGSIDWAALISASPPDLSPFCSFAFPRPNSADACFGLSRSAAV